VRLRSGRPGRYPSPEEAAAYQYTPWEKESARSWTGSHVVGTPDRVRQQLLELAERTGADELMLTTMVYDHDERVRSYELVAEAFDLRLGREQAQAEIA
jgi:alkanesulfonate monooxygenase SsuD/methylene tetrahydromethanopterin reductase-like flavin-dependent oxidoreductase (luciferase family)